MSTITAATATTLTAVSLRSSLNDGIEVGSAKEFENSLDADRHVLQLRLHSDAVDTLDDQLEDLPNSCITW